MNIKKRGRKSVVETFETRKSKATFVVNDKTKFALYLIAKTQNKSVDKVLEELVEWSLTFYFMASK